MITLFYDRKALFNYGFDDGPALVGHIRESFPDITDPDTAVIFQGDFVVCDYDGKPQRDDEGNLKVRHYAFGKDFIIVPWDVGWFYG